MSNWKRQVRGIPQTFQTRDDSGEKYICGYFAVFNSDYTIWDGATESVDPHAFDETLDADIRCLIDHDTRLVLGAQSQEHLHYGLMKKVCTVK